MDTDLGRYLRKTQNKETLRGIVSPLEGLQRDGTFNVLREASPLELFFDLFFVANLATFTAVHEISTGATVGAYVGL